jgi:hypothetical protein
MSRVRSLGLSAIDSFLLKIKRKNTRLLLIVKSRTTIVFSSGEPSESAADRRYCRWISTPRAAQFKGRGVELEETKPESSFAHISENRCRTRTILGVHADLFGARAVLRQFEHEIHLRFLGRWSLIVSGQFRG